MKIAEENRKGFEIAKLIRKQDDKGVIVFITTHDHFAPISCQYLVSDLSFISKNEDYLLIKNHRIQLKLPFIQVDYIEKDGPHRLKLVAEQEVAHF